MTGDKVRGCGEVAGVVSRRAWAGVGQGDGLSPPWSSAVRSSRRWTRLGWPSRVFLLLVCGLLSLAALAGCSPAPPPAETVARPDPTPPVGVPDEPTEPAADEAAGSDAITLAPLLEKVKAWGGRAELDAQGRLTGIDLLPASLSDAEVEQLVESPMAHLQVLRLRGLGITDASMPRLAGLTSLTTLDLDNVGVTDAGVRELVGAQRASNLATASSDPAFRRGDRVLPALPEARNPDPDR
jgi:hypothetical protein